MQEAIDADLLLHVVDAANPAFAEQIAQVQQVLKEIGADGVPQLLIFNKIDALPPEHQPIHMEDTFEIDSVQVPRLFASAKASIGLAALREKLAGIAVGAAASAASPDAESPSSLDLELDK